MARGSGGGGETTVLDDLDGGRDGKRSGSEKGKELHDVGQVRLWVSGDASQECDHRCGSVRIGRSKGWKVSGGEEKAAAVGDVDQAVPVTVIYVWPGGW